MDSEVELKEKYDKYLKEQGRKMREIEEKMLSNGLNRY